MNMSDDFTALRSVNLEDVVIVNFTPNTCRKLCACFWTGITSCRVSTQSKNSEPRTQWIAENVFVLISNPADCECESLLSTSYNIYVYILTFHEIGLLFSVQMIQISQFNARLLQIGTSKLLTMMMFVVFNFYTCIHRPHDRMRFIARYALTLDYFIP
jgi:hypothetical protein